MAISATTRLGLPQWSEGSDPPISRAQANAAFLALEENVVTFTAGEAAERPDPAAAVAHMLYWATDTDTLSYCDGDEWLTIVDVGDLSSYLTIASANSTFLKLSGGTMTGPVNADQQIFSTIGLKDVRHNAKEATNSHEIVVADQDIIVLTVSSAATVTAPPVSPVGTGESIRKRIYAKQSGGSGTLAWANVVWPGGSAPTLTTTDGRWDIFEISAVRYASSTKWFGRVLGQNYDLS